MQKNKQNYLFKIVLTSLLVALNVIIERFLSFNKWDLSFGFSFITVGFAAAFLGIPYAIAVGGLGDIIGALLFPFGTYFVGFTITNVLMALTTGIFLWKSTNIYKISISVLINKVFFSLLLNSIWISILYRGGINALWTVMLPRIPTAIVGFIIEVTVLTVLFSDKSKIKKTFYKQLNKFEI